MALLEVKNLHTYFKTRKGIVKAVNDVSYVLEPGKTVGIVGESGSGKSVSAMSILQLLDGNGYIDASDRQYLIMVMGGDVITNADFDADPTIEATGGSRGDVLFGDDYLHADLNDDDTVNAIDLGIVLNGIGKSGN